MNEAVIRCKLRVHTVKHILNTDGSTESEQVELTAVYGPEGTENAKWSKRTPAAFNQLSKGHEFYVDFVPVEA